MAHIWWFLVAGSCSYKKTHMAMAILGICQKKTTWKMKKAKHFFKIRKDSVHHKIESRWFEPWPYWDGEKVTLSKANRDLQRSRIKRSPAELPGCNSFIGGHQVPGTPTNSKSASPPIPMGSHLLFGNPTQKSLEFKGVLPFRAPKKHVGG